MSFGTIWWKIIVIITRYQVRLSCCWYRFFFSRKCHCRTIKRWPKPEAAHEKPPAYATRVLIPVSKCRHVRYGYSGNKDVQLDCFAILLQNELKSSVACVTTYIQTCLATNQVVAGCEKLLQKGESSCTFYNKICTCCVFTGPRQTTILDKSPWDSTSIFILFCHFRAPS